MAGGSSGGPAAEVAAWALAHRVFRPPPLQARPGVKPNYRQKDMLREWAAAAHLPPKREE